MGASRKLEHIRGAVVPIPHRTAPHAQLKSDIARWLGRRIDEEWDVGTSISVSLGPIGLFDADVLVWRPIKERAFIPIANAALAVEVADTTLGTDLRLKAPDYAAAGLPQLWVVDVNARLTHAFAEPQGGAWAKAEEIPFEQPLACALLPGESLVLAQLNNM